MSANDKTSVGVGRSDWQTPPDLFCRLNDIFRFDYDAWAGHENALCWTYSTAEGTFRRARYYDSSHAKAVIGWEQIDSLDGLRQDWDRRRVFGNPPFSDPEDACKVDGRCKKKRCVTRGYCIDENVPGIPDFAEKHAKERNSAHVNVAILPDARDTTWWRAFVAPYAQDWPLGRVRFINPETGEPGGSPPGGVVAVVFIPDWLARR